MVLVYIVRNGGQEDIHGEEVPTEETIDIFCRTYVACRETSGQHWHTKTGFKSNLWTNTIVSPSQIDERKLQPKRRKETNRYKCDGYGPPSDAALLPPTDGHPLLPPHEGSPDCSGVSYNAVLEWCGGCRSGCSVVCVLFCCSW